MGSRVSGSGRTQTSTGRHLDWPSYSGTVTTIIRARSVPVEVKVFLLLLIVLVIYAGRRSQADDVPRLFGLGGSTVFLLTLILAAIQVWYWGVRRVRMRNRLLVADESTVRIVRLDQLGREVAHAHPFTTRDEVAVSATPIKHGPWNFVTVRLRINAVLVDEVSVLRSAMDTEWEASLTSWRAGD